MLPRTVTFLHIRESAVHARWLSQSDVRSHYFNEVHLDDPTIRVVAQYKSSGDVTLAGLLYVTIEILQAIRTSQRLVSG